MVSVNIYLNFQGNTEEAFNFYKSVFGVEFAMLQRFKETPEADRVAANEGDKIMHIALPVGKGNVLMGTDALESMGHKLTYGNNFSISVSVESKEEADNFFNGLANGGKVTMPLADTFWGSYFGMVTDKFGIQWIMSHDYKRNS